MEKTHVMEIARRISELQGISVANAMGIAAEALGSAEAMRENMTSIISKWAFVKMLERGSVTFTYRNRKGVAHTTKGTLNESLITSRQKVLGSKVAKDEYSVAFYDRSHGVYCTVKMKDIIKIISHE